MAEKYLSVLKSLPAHGPAVEISFKDVSHTIQVPVVDTGITNVAESIVNFVTGPFQKKETKDLHILTGMSGRLRPGTATLVIGNPGGGKTTLLRMLGGRDKPSGGSIQWNGQAPDQQSSGANPGKIAAMAPQVDVHEPLMSVKETFQFAVANCQADLPSDATDTERELRGKMVEHVIDTLGLRECEATIVGDDLTRGISGGQKKRVTIGEALLTGARVLCLDEITNGLDAAVACEIVTFVCDWAHTTGGTVVAALQQVTPEIYRAFDEVIVLSNGYTLYHGPTGGLVPYLGSLGYACPDWMETADYALAVAVSPAFAAEEYSEPDSAVPRPTLLTREALADAWTRHASKAAGGASEPLTGGIVLATAREKAQYGVPHVHSSARHMGLLVSRQAKLVLRNPAVSFGRIVQFVVLASIFGSIFYKISVDNFVVKFSLSIFAASAVSFASFAEIPVIFVSKRTAARHMEAAFYKPFAYTLSVVINALPTSILSTFLFATILYWMTGFADDAGRYFFFVLALIAHEMSIGALFRMYAFGMPREELAQSAAGITTGTFLIFGGFYIPYDKIPPFMWPVYYISPFSWTVRSMVYSEMTSEPYTGAIAPPFNMKPKGEVYLEAFSFAKGMDWKWGGIAYCIATCFLFAFIFSPLLVKYLRIREAPGSQRITDEQFLKAAAAAKAAGMSSSGSKENLAKLAAVEGDSPHSTGSSNPVSGLETPVKGVESSNPLNKDSAVAVAPMPSQAAVSASSALPFTPAALTFKDVTYSVVLPTKAVKPLLRGVTGYALPGTMTALMGASGAGKTTLLDVLAFRKTQGAIGGQIRVNGCEVSAAAFSRMNGFAEQQDVHADYQTVREAIEFSALLRLPAAVSPAARQAFVEEVLTLLELQPLAGRRTGSLSPGELKRLTIGVELAANPPMILLDEPTTGLDARSAAVVMRVIRNIANTGRTVIATIHQPSADVFFAFDNLLCLVPGGYQTYNGPLHGAHKHAEQLVKFLEAVPGVRPLPHGVNPATWMLEEMASVSANAASAEVKGEVTPSADSAPTPAPGHALKIREVDAEAGKASTVNLSDYFSASPLAKSTASIVETICTTGKTGLPALALTPGFATQFGALFKRMTLFMWRNTLWNGLRLFVFVFLALFFGLLYLRIDDSDQAGVFGKLAVALNSILFISIINLNTGIPSYAALRAVYYREKAAGFYSAAAYPLSLMLAELPWTIFFGIVYLSINYFLIGFSSDAGDFFTAFLACVLCPWWFAVIGMGMIGFFPFPLLANIFGGLTIQISILFAGVNLSVNDLPEGWRWMYYADGFAHALRLFMLPQYDGDTTPIRVVVNGRPVLAPRNAFIERQLGTTPDKTWEALGWLILIVWGAAFLAAVFYVKVNHQKR